MFGNNDLADGNVFEELQTQSLNGVLDALKEVVEADEADANVVVEV